MTTTIEEPPQGTVRIGTELGQEATVSASFELMAGKKEESVKEVRKSGQILAISPARFPVHPSYDFANPMAQQMFWLLKRFEGEHDVTVVCMEGSDFKNVVHFVSNEERSASVEIANMVKFEDYDLIVDFSDEKWSYRVAKEKKIQTLYIMNPQLEYRTAPPGLKHPCLVGASDAHCSHLSSELGMPVKKLPFGYEPPGDVPQRDDKNYLLYFGKVVKEKGVHELINICRKRKIDLVIAGDDRWKGVEQNYVYRILEECDGGSIRYVGAVDENVKAKLIAEAHAVVVPYLTDFNAYGCLTARATTALKVPVIAINKGAVPEFIEPGINGAYCSSIEELEMFDFENLTMTFDGPASAPDYERFEQLVEMALRSPW